MRMIKDENRKNDTFKDFKITPSHFEEEASEGEISEKLGFLTNSKIMIVKIIQLRYVFLI